MLVGRDDFARLVANESPPVDANASPGEVACAAINDLARLDASNMSELGLLLAKAKGLDRASFTESERQRALILLKPFGDTVNANWPRIEKLQSPVHADVIYSGQQAYLGYMRFFTAAGEALDNTNMDPLTALRNINDAVTAAREALRSALDDLNLARAAGTLSCPRV